MKRGKIFRRFIPYLALLIIFVGIIASAAVQTVTWTHDTGWTRSDGTKCSILLYVIMADYTRVSV